MPGKSALDTIVLAARELSKAIYRETAFQPTAVGVAVPSDLFDRALLLYVEKFGGKWSKQEVYDECHKAGMFKLEVDRFTLEVQRRDG